MYTQKYILNYTLTDNIRNKENLKRLGNLFFFFHYFLTKEIEFPKLDNNKISKTIKIEILEKICIQNEIGYCFLMP